MKVDWHFSYPLLRSFCFWLYVTSLDITFIVTTADWWCSWQSALPMQNPFCNHEHSEILKIALKSEDTCSCRIYDYLSTESILNEFLTLNYCPKTILNGIASLQMTARKRHDFHELQPKERSLRRKRHEENKSFRNDRVDDIERMSKKAYNMRNDDRQRLIDNVSLLISHRRRSKKKRK